ncbi:MAG TPA: tetratricopeptide repeat protein, partial [Magnetospirillaceae bacterium]|nr:tetratricopeptide repeat protein [Magnetospirillaceae bacterium]
MRRIRMALFPALLFSIASAVHGQAEADARLAAGVRLFGEEKFSVALEHFSRMLADPAAAVRRPDALYWSGLSHLALGKIDDARRVLDTFLREYPDHASASDALYQRARVSYLAARYEESIRLFAAFLERYPDHFFASSALYWTADSLFLLGRLTESEALFRTLAAEHPRSLKYEATAYKLALIRLRFRENELLTLLRWSHEESLRLIEEFQRREREQSLAVYQRRLEETAAQAEA